MESTNSLDRNTRQARGIRITASNVSAATHTTLTSSTDSTSAGFSVVAVSAVSAASAVSGGSEVRGGYVYSVRKMSLSHHVRKILLRPSE